MYRQNLFYPGYSNFRYNSYMPNFNTTYYPYVSYDEIVNNDDEIIDNENIEQNVDSSNTIETEATNNKDTTNQTRFGPIEFDNERLSLFGFSLAIDDLILVGLIILLLLESDTNNWALIIVLGLMLFNINFSNLNLF